MVKRCVDDQAGCARPTFFHSSSAVGSGGWEVGGEVGGGAGIVPPWLLSCSRGKVAQSWGESTIAVANIANRQIHQHSQCELEVYVIGKNLHLNVSHWNFNFHCIMHVISFIYCGSKFNLCCLVEFLYFWRTVFFSLQPFSGPMFHHESFQFVFLIYWPVLLSLSLPLISFRS